jgi:hypothetical protein
MFIPSFTPDYFKHIILETLPITTSYGTSMKDGWMMKTCQTWMKQNIQKRGEKGTRW